MKDVADVTAPVGTVTIEPVHHLARYWQDAGSLLRWDCLFMLPPWFGVWLSYFGQVSKTHLYVIRQHDVLLGLVPLMVRGDTAYLIGDSDLIDYSDFIVAPSREKEFLSTLVDHLRRQGIGRLETGRVREDSAAVSCLRAYAEPLGCSLSCEPVDVSSEMELPETWDEYLSSLSGRERHEMRRKLRRLESAGHIRQRVIGNKADVLAEMDTFVALFRSNRPEKAQFMTGAVESFFRSLAGEMADAGLLKLFSLDIDDAPAAAAMCFDYSSTVYLYNNGYDGRFSRLSVGLLNTAFIIRESITHGRKKFNLLRGNETYKGRLGAHPLKLHQCEVILR